MKNFLKNFIIFIFMMSPVFLFFLLIFLIETPYKFTVTYDNIDLFNSFFTSYTVNIGDKITLKAKYDPNIATVGYDCSITNNNNEIKSTIIHGHNKAIQSYIDKNAIHIADFVALLFILSIIINCIIINYTITKNKRLDYEK